MTEKENATAAITHCRVNDLIHPVGIDNCEIYFSWNVRTDIPDFTWDACRIRIYVVEKEIWDSGLLHGDCPVRAHYTPASLKEKTRYTWQVSLYWLDRLVAESDCSSWFETGICEDSWKCGWVGSPFQETQHMPIFRRSFVLQKKISRARAYISGVGHYELRCNGKKVGDDVLEPAWTNYDKSVCYAVYELEDYVITGENVLGILLGNGMYHVPGGRYTKFQNSFGPVGFLLRLEVQYTDGSCEALVSDGEFRAALGPITFSCVYGGEDYDSTFEHEGWDCPDFEENEEWIPAVPISGPKGRIVSRKYPPLKIREDLEARRIGWEDKALVYDTGRNLSGWFRLRLRGPEGFRIRVTPFEMRDKDGSLSQQFTGTPHYYQYTLSGDSEEIWEPRFTYYGFRYLKIEAADPDPAGNFQKQIEILELKGRMIYPCLEKIGDFSCSAPMWNQIHEIITRAILCNTKSVFTDCPHREKLGWLEQLHLIGPGIIYNYEIYGLFRKVLADMREAQLENGLIPDTAPEYINFDTEGIHTGFRDSPEWGSAGIIVPWYLYCTYGDTGILEENYGMMRRYLEYLTSKSQYHILHHGLGDWCDFGLNPPFAQNTPIPVTATAIYYYDIIIMRQIASVLGRMEDASCYGTLGEQVKAAFRREFFDDQGMRYATGSQTANAMALFTGLADEADVPEVLTNLVEDIRRRGYHSTGGDVGYPFLVRALDKYGRQDIMANMLNQTDAPSYGYQVIHGATTLCEEWNGNDPDHPSSSQNHFMLGAAEEWFYSGLAGLKSIHDRMDFGKPEDMIRIEPYFAPQLTWVRAWHRYPKGKVEISWKRTPEKIKLCVSIPAGAKGMLILPVQYQIAGTDSINSSGCEHRNGKICRKLKSGAYEFYIVPVPESEII